MIPKISRAFRKIENRRHQLFKFLSTVSEGQFTYAQTKAGWNSAQIIRHLILTDRVSMAYLKKKIHGLQSLPQVKLMDHLKFGLLILSLFLPLKFKAPPGVQVEAETASMSELKAEWDQLREELKIVLDQYTEEDLTRATYRHPRTGYLTILEMLDFYDAHLIHHERQIRRLIAKAA